MAIDFPNSPTNGETHAVGSFTWQYDGEKWVAANGIISRPGYRVYTFTGSGSITF
jgi:hypothetical protein